jgi:hypothetical protein
MMTANPPHLTSIIMVAGTGADANESTPPNEETALPLLPIAMTTTRHNIQNDQRRTELKGSSSALNVSPLRVGKNNTNSRTQVLPG